MIGRIPYGGDHAVKVGLTVRRAQRNRVGHDRVIGRGAGTIPYLIFERSSPWSVVVRSAAPIGTPSYS